MTGTIGERVRARIQDFIGSDARQQDVAEAVNMTPDAFSRSLNGQRQFATLELVRVATYLQTSMHWLATGEPDPAATKVAARHTFDPVSLSHDAVDWSSERTAIETVAAAYTQVFRGAGRQNSVEVPLSASAARDALREHDPNFVSTFAESIESVFGVQVVRIPEATRPYSIEVVGRRIVVVPPHVNWFYQNWSIAHELGHFASGNLEPIEEAPAASGAAERLANAYAAELLLPESEMRGIDWSNSSKTDLAEYLWHWGVSTDAVKRRLAALGIVPGDEVREVLNMATQRALRRHWIDDSSTMWVDSITDRMERANTRRFPAALLSAHTDAVATGRQGPNFLAWMLGTDPAVLESELGPADETPDLDWLLEEMDLDHSPTS
jgi:Zn-dependent peptidase ImmA (M78 family)